MSALGPDFYRITVTLLLTALLLATGGVGILMAVPLAGCAAYQTRRSARSHPTSR